MTRTYPMIGERDYAGMTFHNEAEFQAARRARKQAARSMPDRARGRGRAHTPDQARAYARSGASDQARVRAEDIHDLPPVEPVNSGPSEQYSEQDRRELHEDISLFVHLGIDLLCDWQQVRQEVRPTERELDAMLTPAERIVMRRVKRRVKTHPDARDAGLIAYALLKYGVRVYGTRPQAARLVPGAPPAQSATAARGSNQSRGNPQTPVAGQANGDAGKVYSELSLSNQLAALHGRFKPYEWSGDSGSIGPGVEPGVQPGG
jgi:hypothetical protein